MNIEMISTGDEVLCGYITDTNSTFLSAELLNIGLKIHRRTTVGDNMDELVNIFTERSTKADVVIVNGGMGPTTDDLSRFAAAKAAGVGITLRPELVAHMKAWFQERNKEMPSCNQVQAEIPEGSEIIPNEIGTACGFMHTIGNCTFIFTPGVPSEFKKMVTDWIIPYLKSNYPIAQHSKVELYYSFGIGESMLGEILEKEKWPNNIVLGYRVDNPYIEIKLISENAEATDFDEARRILQKAANQYIIASKKFDFYQQISSKLNGRSLVIEDLTSNGTIFSLAQNIPNVNGTINTKLTSLNDNALVLRLFRINQDTTGDARELCISLEDNTTNRCITRNLRFGVAQSRIGLYGSFMALDILRRYLNNQNPNVEYEYVKSITNLS